MLPCAQLMCLFPAFEVYWSSSALRQGDESNIRTGSRSRVVEAV